MQTGMTSALYPVGVWPSSRFRTGGAVHFLRTQPEDESRWGRRAVGPNGSEPPSAPWPWVERGGALAGSEGRRTALFGLGSARPNGSSRRIERETRRAAARSRRRVANGTRRCFWAWRCSVWAVSQRSFQRSLHPAWRHTSMAFPFSRSHRIPAPLSRASPTTVFTRSPLPDPLGQPASWKRGYDIGS